MGKKLLAEIKADAKAKRPPSKWRRYGRRAAQVLGVAALVAAGALAAIGYNELSEHHRAEGVKRYQAEHCRTVETKAADYLECNARLKG